MKPSAPVSSSLTNRPARVAPEMWPVKVAPIAVGEEMRDQAIDGLALGRHGAPLGGRDARRDLAQGRHVLALGQAVRPELQRADQGPVHDQVGVAADRRGEMRVAAQREPEVPVVLGRIFGLRLGAQHHLVHQLLVLACPSPAPGCG